MGILWFAPQAELKVSSTISSVSSSVILPDQMTQISQATEDTTITIGKTTLGAADDVLKVGQSFKPLVPRIDKIILKAFKSGTPTDNLQVAIHQDNSGAPAVTAITGTTVVVAGSSLGGSAAEVTWDFTDKDFTLTVGKTYWFVISRSGAQSDTDYYDVRYKGTGSSYADGLLSRTDDGTTWTSTATDDIYMKVFGGSIADIVKEVRISGAERDAETVKFIGYNESLDEKRATIVEATFTAAFQNKMIATMLCGTPALVTGTSYYRIRAGEKSSADRVPKAMMFQLQSGSNFVNVLMNNAYMTTVEDSLAADGHMEQTFTFKCLAKDYYEEDNFQ